MTGLLYLISNVCRDYYKGSPSSKSSISSSIDISIKMSCGADKAKSLAIGGSYDSCSGASTFFLLLIIFVFLSSNLVCNQENKE